MEAGFGLERAHMGIFTELGVRNANIVDRRHYRYPRPRWCSRRRRRPCRRPARRRLHPRRSRALALATADRAVAIASARFMADAAAQPATAITLAAAAATALAAAAYPALSTILCTTGLRTLRIAVP
eukprot:scaffold14061_cov63-Phaeocystis_antarctica.AAC.1